MQAIKCQVYLHGLQGPGGMVGKHKLNTLVIISVLADLVAVETPEKRRERIWSSYYKRMERMARAWGSQKRIWDV